jgi:hypothetical protein
LSDQALTSNPRRRGRCNTAPPLDYRSRRYYFDYFIQCNDCLPGHPIPFRSRFSTPVNLQGPSQDINECLAGTDKCDPIGTCTNTAGSDTCSCPTAAGYTLGSDGLTCVYNATLAALNSAGNQTNAPVYQAATYFIHLRATNRAGSRSPAAISSGMTIDQTTPIFETFTFLDPTGQPLYYLSSSNVIVRWNFYDTISTISSYTYALTTCPNPNPTDWITTNIGFATATINLSGASRVLLTITATNAALLSSSVQVNITVAPGPPNLSRATIDVADFGRALSYNFTNIADPTGLYTLELGLGSLPNATDVLPFVSLNTSLSEGFVSDYAAGVLPGIVTSLVGLPNVWWTVRATDGAALMATKSTNYSSVLVGNNSALITTTKSQPKAFGFDNAAVTANMTGTVTNASMAMVLIPLDSYQRTVANMSTPASFQSVVAGEKFANFTHVQFEATLISTRGTIVAQSFNMTLHISGLTGSKLSALPTVGLHVDPLYYPVWRASCHGNVNCWHLRLSIVPYSYSANFLSVLDHLTWKLCSVLYPKPGGSTLGSQQGRHSRLGKITMNEKGISGSCFIGPRCLCSPWALWRNTRPGCRPTTRHCL